MHGKSTFVSMLLKLLTYLVNFGVNVFCSISIKFQCFHRNVTFFHLFRPYFVRKIHECPMQNRILYNTLSGLTKMPVQAVREPVMQSPLWAQAADGSGRPALHRGP